MESSWFNVLSEEFEQTYMKALHGFLNRAMDDNRTIFPSPEFWFNAFNSTPFNDVKVVILGQDPYHGPNQSHGLCFSVRPDVPIPPSLRNILKELHRELEIPTPSRGCLQRWADQGVLLLNATLTVEQGQAGSHQGQGWEQFTDKAIQLLSDKRQGIVFLLWGSYAQKKGRFIDEKKHLVLKSPHPSPLSAHRGFFGCNHFIQTNDYLLQAGKTEIDWSLD
ncbi:MAG: uracil-DNA glycosylase [Oceanicoccus sp.]